MVWAVVWALVWDLVLGLFACACMIWQGAQGAAAQQGGLCGLATHHLQALRQQSNGWLWGCCEAVVGLLTNVGSWFRRCQGIHQSAPAQSALAVYKFSLPCSRSIIQFVCTPTICLNRTHYPRRRLHCTDTPPLCTHILSIALSLTPLKCRLRLNCVSFKR